jgi:hypothetical protein
MTELGPTEECQFSLKIVTFMWQADMGTPLPGGADYRCILIGRCIIGNHGNYGIQKANAL